MKTIKLDLTGCKYWDDLHEKIRIAFSFSEDYGRNWDAFWDLLWSECDADHVVIKGEKSLPEELKKSLDILHKTLEDNKKFRSDHKLDPFSYEVID